MRNRTRRLRTSVRFGLRRGVENKIVVSELLLNPASRLKNYLLCIRKVQKGSKIGTSSCRLQYPIRVHTCIVLCTSASSVGHPLMITKLKPAVVRVGRVGCSPSSRACGGTRGAPRRKTTSRSGPRWRGSAASAASSSSRKLASRRWVIKKYSKPQSVCADIYYVPVHE